MKKIIILTGLSFFAFVVKAQIITPNDLSKTITLNDSTVDKRMYLPVTNNMADIHFFFKTRLSEGSVTVNIEDPEGKNEGGFKITADQKMNEDGEKGSKGQMATDINLPLQGNWLIHVQYKHATGTFFYEIKPSYKW